MDAITLDALIAETRPHLLGRHVERVALGGPEALLLELAGRSRLCLRLDVSRATPGLYLLGREESRSLLAPLPEARGGPARHALLLFRKYLEGRRAESLARIAGQRVVTLGLGGGRLVLHLSAASALTFDLGGEPVVSLGGGRTAVAVPRPLPESEWDRVDPVALATAIQEGARAVLELCPSLGPALARRLVAGNDSVATLRRRLATPRPTLVATVPLAELTDAQLAEPGSVLLLPFVPDPPGAVHSPESAREAARLFLEARQRGAAFAARRKGAVDGARREVRRLRALEGHLADDLSGLPDETTLRRLAGALLATAHVSIEKGASSVTLPDPQAPGERLLIPVDPVLSGPANADRLFAKARRIRQAREQIAARLADTRPAIERALEREAWLLSARNLAEIVGDVSEPKRALSEGAAREEKTGGSRARHYLTSGGLSIRVGRGARENHQLTFGLARPEDFWLHARDVPGAHVVLQDVSGRAGAQDLREAAELAAFFSEARGDSGVDVHVTRRKHVRPGGGAGRVRIGHSDTLRVAPRDPEGRLRKR